MFGEFRKLIVGFAGMELKVLHWAGEIGDGTGQGGDWAIGDWAIGPQN